MFGWPQPARPIFLCFTRSMCDVSQHERWLQGVTASGALEGTASDAGDASEGGGGSGGTETPTSWSWNSTRSDDSGNRPAARATLLIGMPVITSRRGLQFWLDLCEVSDRGLREEALHELESPAAAAAVAAEAESAKGRDRNDDNASPTPLGLKKGTREGATKDGDGVKSGRPCHRGSGLRSVNCGGSIVDADRGLTNGGGGEVSSTLMSARDEDEPFGQVWFETTMSRLKDLGGDGSPVAGVHVMAPGSGPRERAEALVSAGVFGERR